MITDQQVTFDFLLEQREASPAAMSGTENRSRSDTVAVPGSWGGEGLACRRWRDGQGERGPQLPGTGFCSPHEQCVECRKIEPIWWWFRPATFDVFAELYSQPLWSAKPGSK
jgi:hypothetical protein